MKTLFLFGTILILRAKLSHQGIILRPCECAPAPEVCGNDWKTYPSFCDMKCQNSKTEALFEGQCGEYFTRLRLINHYYPIFHSPLAPPPIGLYANSPNHFPSNKQFHPIPPYNLIWKDRFVSNVPISSNHQFHPLYYPFVQPHTLPCTPTEEITDNVKESHKLVLAQNGPEIIIIASAPGGKEHDDINPVNSHSSNEHKQEAEDIHKIADTKKSTANNSTLDSLHSTDIIKNFTAVTPNTNNDPVISTHESISVKAQTIKSITANDHVPTIDESVSTISSTTNGTESDTSNEIVSTSLNATKVTVSTSLNTTDNLLKPSSTDPGSKAIGDSNKTNQTEHKDLEVNSDLSENYNPNSTNNSSNTIKSTTANDHDPTIDEPDPTIDKPDPMIASTTNVTETGTSKEIVSTSLNATKVTVSTSLNTTDNLLKSSSTEPASKAIADSNKTNQTEHEDREVNSELSENHNSNSTNNSGKTIKSTTANDHDPTIDESNSKGSNSRHEPDPMISSTTNGTNSGISNETVSTPSNATEVTVSTSLNTTEGSNSKHEPDPMISSTTNVTKTGTSNEIVSTSLNAPKVTVSTSLNTTDNLLKPSSTDPASKAIEDSNKTNQTEHEDREVNSELSENHKPNSTNISGKTIKSTTANDHDTTIDESDSKGSNSKHEPDPMISSTTNGTESGISNETVSTSPNATEITVSTSLNTTDNLLKPSSADPASKAIADSNKTNQTVHEDREANSDLSENHNPNSTSNSGKTIKSTTANDHDPTIDQSDPNISNTTNGTESSILSTPNELVYTTLNATKSSDNLFKPNSTDPASKTIEDGNKTNQTEHEEPEANADVPKNYNPYGTNNSGTVSEGKLDGKSGYDIHLLNFTTDYPINIYQDKHEQSKTNSTTFLSEMSYTNNGPIVTTPNITDNTPIQSINQTDRSAELDSSTSEGDESKEKSSTNYTDTAALKGLLLFLKTKRPETKSSSKRYKHEELGLAPKDENIVNDSSLEYIEPINRLLKLLQNNNDSDDKINITNKDIEKSYYKPDSITTKNNLTEEENDLREILSLPLNSKERGNISILFNDKKVLPLLSQKLNHSSNHDELSTAKKTFAKKISNSANKAIKYNDKASDGKHHKKYKKYKVNKQQEKLLLEPHLIEELQKKPQILIESSSDDNNQHQKKSLNKKEKILGLQLISSAKTNGRDNNRNPTNDDEESENNLHMTKHSKNTQDFVKVVLKLFFTKEPRSDVGEIYEIDEKIHKNVHHKKNRLKDVKNLEEILTKIILSRVNKSQKKHSKQDLEKLLTALASSVYIKEKDNDENSTEYDEKRQKILKDEKYFENLLSGLLSTKGAHQTNSKSSSSSSMEWKYKDNKNKNTIDSDSENASFSSSSGNENSRTKESSDLASNTITMKTNSVNGFSSSSSGEEYLRTEETSGQDTNTINIDTKPENASSSSSSDYENSITEESHDLDTDSTNTNAEDASFSSFSREDTSKNKKSSDLHTDTITIDTNSGNGFSSSYSNEEYSKTEETSGQDTNTIIGDKESDNTSSSSSSGNEKSITEDSNDLDTDTIDTNAENASPSSFSREENSKSKTLSDLHTDTITIDTNLENTSSSSYSDEGNSRTKESSGKDTETITNDTNSEDASASSSSGEGSSRTEESSDLDTGATTIDTNSKNLSLSSLSDKGLTSKDNKDYKNLLKKHSKDEEDSEVFSKFITSENINNNDQKREKEIAEALSNLFWSENYNLKTNKELHLNKKQAKHEGKLTSSSSEKWQSTSEGSDDDEEEYKKLLKKHSKSKEDSKEVLTNTKANENNLKKFTTESDEGLFKKKHTKGQKELEELSMLFWNENHNQKKGKEQDDEQQDVHNKREEHQKKLHNSSSKEWKSTSKDIYSDKYEDKHKRLLENYSKGEDLKEELLKLISSESTVKNSNKKESHENMHKKKHPKREEEIQEELLNFIWSENRRQKNKIEHEELQNKVRAKQEKKIHSSNSKEWKSTSEDTDSDDDKDKYEKLIKIHFKDEKHLKEELLKLIETKNLNKNSRQKESHENLHKKNRPKHEKELEEELLKFIWSENHHRKNNKNKSNEHQDLHEKRRAKHSRNLHSSSSREWELTSKEVEKLNNKHSKSEENLKQVMSELNENILKKSNEKQNIHKNKHWRDEELKELLKLFSSGELHKENTHENSLISITIEKTKPTSESSSNEKKSNYVQLSFRNTNQEPNNNNSSSEDGGPAEILNDNSNLENGGPAEVLQNKLLRNINKISEPNLTIPVSEDIDSYNLKNLTIRKINLSKEALESPLLSSPASSTKHSKVNVTEDSYLGLNDENTAEINLKGNNTAPLSTEAEVPLENNVNNQTDSKVNLTTAAIEHRIPSSFEVKPEPPKVNVEENILELATSSLLCPFCTGKNSISGEISVLKYPGINDGNTAQANLNENNTDSSTTRAEIPLGYSMKNETDSKKEFIKDTIEYPIPSSLALYDKQPKINITEGIISELSPFITEPSLTEAETPLDYNLKNQSHSKNNFTNAYIEYPLPSSHALNEKIQKINLTEGFIKYLGSNNDNTAETNLNENDTKLSSIVAEVPLEYNSKNQIDNDVTYSKKATKYSLSSSLAQNDPLKVNLTEAEIIELPNRLFYPPLSTNTNSTIKEEELLINNKGSNKGNITQTNVNIKKTVEELEPSGKESIDQDTISDDAIISKVRDNRLYKYNPKTEHNRQKVYNKHSRGEKGKKQTNENFDDGDDSFSSEKDNFEKKKQSKNLINDHAALNRRRNKLKGLLSIIIHNPQTDTASGEVWSELSKVISSANAKKEQSSENFHDNKISQNKHHKNHSKYKKTLIDELSKLISSEDIKGKGSREQHKDDDHKNEHDLIEELIEQIEKTKRRDNDVDHKYENYISQKKHHEKTYSKNEKDPIKELYNLISNEGLKWEHEYENHKHYNKKSQNKHLKDLQDSTELSKVLSSDRDTYYLQSTDDDKQQKSAEPDSNDEKDQSQIKENKIKHSKDEKDLEEAMSKLLSSREINEDSKDGNPKNDTSEIKHAKEKHSKGGKDHTEDPSIFIIEETNGKYNNSDLKDGDEESQDNNNFIKESASGSSRKTKSSSKEPSDRDTYYLQSTNDDEQQKSSEPDSNDEKDESQIKENKIKHSKDEKDLEEAMSKLLSSKEINEHNRDDKPKNDESEIKHAKRKNSKGGKNYKEGPSILISEKSNGKYNNSDNDKSQQKYHKKKESEDEKDLIEGLWKLISSSKTKGKHSDNNSKNSKKIQKKHHKNKSKLEQDLTKELSEIFSKKETKGKDRSRYRVPKKDNDESRQKHHKKKHFKNQKELYQMLSKLISEERKNGVEKRKKDHKNHRSLDAKTLKKVL